MQFDVRTVLMMISALGLLFALYFAIAGYFLKETKATWHWSLANLCIFLGFSYIFVTHENADKNEWSFGLLFVSTIISAGICLQLSGIMEFKSGRSNVKLSLIFICIFFLQNVWFIFLEPNAVSRVVSNSVMVSFIFGVCAYKLMNYKERSMKIVCGISGVSFAILAFAGLIRVIFVASSHNVGNLVTSNYLANQLPFVIDFMCHLMATLGFVMMLSMKSILESQRATAKEALANREHRQFISMLTHELRVPLAVIDGSVQSLQILKHGEESEIELELRYRRIRRSVGRITELVKQFLADDIPQQLEVNGSAVDCVDVTWRAIQFAALDSTDRIKLKYQEKLICSGEFSLIQTALLNLLDNAIKYSPPDSVIEIQIEKLICQNKLGVAWTVADHGDGIPFESRDHVFEKYVRGDRHSGIAGIGLGLYLVHRIADLHEGNVTILDRDGWGAVLRFWIPIERSSSAENSYS